jgi:coenzyme F420-reducing hydrogenase delta subunit
MAEAQALLKAEGLSPQRLKMAAICSVCAENFAKHMNQFSEALIAMRSAGAKS